MAETSLSVVFYTANIIPERFAHAIRAQILEATDCPIISVSHKPLAFGKNIVVNIERSHINIYRQALIGAQAATTEYIALCEDDVLYSPEHFRYRPSPGKFAYNLCHWNIYTWEQVFSWKGRRNLHSLVCERQLFIEAMEERFRRWPEGSDPSIWAEPGKYERQLGVNVRETEDFYTNPPNIAFSHETALSYKGLGKRKRLGELRATEIPYWGNVKEITKLYE